MLWARSEEPDALLPRLLPDRLPLTGLRRWLPAWRGLRPGRADVTPNAVTGDAIEVTALDAPPPAAAPGATASAGDSTGGSGRCRRAPDRRTSEAARRSAAADATAVEAPPRQARPTPRRTGRGGRPPPPKSDRQIACESKGGTWADTGGRVA